MMNDPKTVEFPGLRLALAWRHASAKRKPALPLLSIDVRFSARMSAKKDRETKWRNIYLENQLRNKDRFSAKIFHEPLTLHRWGLYITLCVGLSTRRKSLATAAFFIVL